MKILMKNFVANIEKITIFAVPLGKILSERLKHLRKQALKEFQSQFSLVGRASHS